MKKIVRAIQEPIFSMSKLRSDFASVDRTGEIPEFIYFSEVMVGHRPCVKFYGGTKETQNAANCPSMLMSKEHGAGDVEILSWHTKKNSPNAWNPKVTDRVAEFVDRNLPLLLLAWFRKLDESYLLQYFEGTWPWHDTLNYVTDVSDDVKRRVVKSKSVMDLHQICLMNNLYEF